MISKKLTKLAEEFVEEFRREMVDRRGSGGVSPVEAGGLEAVAIGEILEMFLWGAYMSAKKAGRPDALKGYHRSLYVSLTTEIFARVKTIPMMERGDSVELERGNFYRSAPEWGTKELRRSL